MRKIKVISIILCSIILFRCTPKPDLTTLKKGTAIVAGNVKNWQKGSKTIRFAAEGIVKSIEQTVIIDSLGNFEAKIEMFHPQNVNVFYEKGFVELCLRPSDSLYLDIDEKIFTEQRFPVFNISGLGEDVMTSENLRDYLIYQGESSFDPVARNKSVEEYAKVLREEISRKDSILQVFCKDNKTTPDFRDWAKNDIKYGVANYIISYRFVNQGNDIGALFDKTMFPVDNDVAIITGLYGLHLRHYALNLAIWQDSVSLNLLRNRDYLDAYIRSLDRIVKKEKRGLSRDVMCYKLMLDLYDNSVEDFNAFVEDVEKYIDNGLLRGLLKQKKIDFEKQEDVKITFLDPKTKDEKVILGDFWKELTSKYINKVIYIDIWATWCGPCRGEIPYAIDLHEYYKDKEIAFVNLCLASDKKEWEMMIENSHIEGNNYFFNKPQTQLLREKLKFDGYPTYMIIDKKGNLINKNAPRPSSTEELKNILNKLIDK